jgi:hypothetical protein
MEKQKSLDPLRVGFYTFIAFAFLALALMPLNATAQIFSQDLTMHSKTTSSGMVGMKGADSTTTTYYSKNAMKTSSQDGKDYIIWFDSQKIVSIDNNEKTYSEATFQQLQDALDQAAAAMGENQEDMAAALKMMGMDDVAVTVAKAGPGETIAGYPTEKYILKGPMQMEIFAAKSLKIPAAYYDITKLRMPPNPVFDMNALVDEMKKIEGLPLKSVMTMKMMNMEVITTEEVTSIEKGAIPASVFEVPAGYKLVKGDLD